MIEVRDLVKNHGSLRVLDGVTLSVAPRRGGGDHRPVRRRQEHVLALHQRARNVPGRRDWRRPNSRFRREPPNTTPPIRSASCAAASAWSSSSSICFRT